MQAKRYTEEQTIRVLEEERAGTKVMVLYRKYGMSDATFCNWKSKYSGMTASDLRRRKFLEEENSIVADLRKSLSVSLNLLYYYKTIFIKKRPLQFVYKRSL